MSGTNPPQTFFPPYGYQARPARDYESIHAAPVPVQEPAIRMRGTDEPPYTKDELYRMVYPPAQDRRDRKQPPHPEGKAGGTATMYLDQVADEQKLDYKERAILIEFEYIQRTRKLRGLDKEKGVFYSWWAHQTLKTHAAYELARGYAAAAKLAQSDIEALKEKRRQWYKAKTERGGAERDGEAPVLQRARKRARTTYKKRVEVLKQVPLRTANPNPTE